LNKNFNKTILSLLWIVFTDSIGWGIAFSVFAALFLDRQTAFLSSTLPDSSRYMIYEFVLASYSIFMFLFAPVIGGISDCYGRKPSLKISMLGLTIGFIFSALGCYWSSLSILIIGRVISGMTAGSFSVAQAAVVDISNQHTKSFYFSLLVIANCLGFSFGPVLEGMFIHNEVLPTGTITFLVGAGMSLIGFFSVLFLFNETYIPDKLNTKLNIWNDFLNIKIAFFKPILNKYLISFLFSMIAYGLFFSYVPIFLHQQFMTSSSSIGVILSALTILLSLSLLLAGKYIFSHFDKKKSILSIQFFLFVVYIILSFYIRSFLFSCFLLGCTSFLIGLMYIGLLTLISDATEKNWQGRVMGVVASVSAITWGIGPILSGVVSSMGASAGFICAALLMSVGFGTFILSKKTIESISNSTTLV
jgi:MFS transporter, DHA1 family, tetracycline resistance protein